MHIWPSKKSSCDKKLLLPCRVLEWLRSFAAERSLKWKQDKEGNMVILRPGSNGGEDAKPVIVQV